MRKRFCEAEHQNTREFVVRRSFSIKSRGDDESHQIRFPSRTFTGVLYVLFVLTICIYSEKIFSVNSNMNVGLNKSLN